MSESLSEPDLVDRWWSEVVDEPSDLGDGSPSFLASLGEYGIALAFGLLGLSGIEFQHDRGKRWPETIVKVATEPFALLLAGRDEAQPGGLQFGGELPGPHGDRRLAGQVVQERCVAVGDVRPGGRSTTRLPMCSPRCTRGTRTSVVLSGRGLDRTFDPDVVDFDGLGHRM